jgi:hypothetical protein
VKKNTICKAGLTGLPAWLACRVLITEDLHNALIEFSREGH